MWTSYEVDSSQEQIATSSMFLQSKSREFMEQVAGISCEGFLRQYVQEATGRFDIGCVHLKLPVRFSSATSHVTSYKLTQFRSFLMWNIVAKSQKS